jgi:hypothetical protein
MRFLPGDKRILWRKPGRGAPVVESTRADDKRSLKMEERSVSLLEKALRIFRTDPKEARETPSEMPGRNEPCWCGSGRKYKKCHLPGDEKKTAGACSLNCGPG